MMQKETLIKELTNLKEILDSDLDSLSKYIEDKRITLNIKKEFEDIKKNTLLNYDIWYFIEMLDFGRLANDCDEYPSMRYLDSIEKFVNWLYKNIELGVYD